MSPELALRTQLDSVPSQVRLLQHPPCRTSAESAAARASAGAPTALGAKALVVSTGGSFTMLVIPGSRRLDSGRARAIVGRFRFARPEEVSLATGGLEIGTIPPFGRTVFPRIERLVVDELVAGAELIGFNAACLTRSAVMGGRAYVELARPDAIVSISIPAEAGAPG